jgi:hypothetical protein
MIATSVASALSLAALAAPALAQGYYDRDYDGYDTHIVTNTPNNPTNTNGVQSGYYSAMDDRMAWNDRYGPGYRPAPPPRYRDYDRDDRAYYRDRWRDEDDGY